MTVPTTREVAVGEAPEVAEAIKTSFTEIASNTGGFAKMQDVVDSFLLAISDTSLNGSAIVVADASGNRVVHKYPHTDGTPTSESLRYFPNELKDAILAGKAHL